MLDSLLAQKLAKKIMKQLGYNINIMNDKGIIIASGDTSRIGCFHEVAYKIINDKLNVGVAKEVGDGIGIRAGVNMPIVYENQIIGVVGISGNPDEIMKFAQLVKLSVEIMLEHEFYKEQVLRKQTNKNALLNALLNEDPVNTSRIEKLANELHYQEKYYRIPIIIRLPATYNSKYILSQIRSVPSHLKQDMTFEISSDRILVFKSIYPDPVKNFKGKILQYISEINDTLINSKENAKCLYYIGTLQKEYLMYRQAYQHAIWLENNITDAEEIHFFIDYATEYLKNSIPHEVYEGIFSTYRELLESAEKYNLLETVEAFYKNQQSISNTAKSLYLHRNTVLFRLKKLKHLMGIDLLDNGYDSHLMTYLLYYYNSF